MGTPSPLQPPSPLPSPAPSDPPPPNPEKPPSPWSLLHEDSKTIITLSTAFLGLTVTFSDKLFVGVANGIEIALLIFIWIILCAVTAMGIYASAGLSNYLRLRRANANASIRFLTLAFTLLVFASILFIIFGGIQVSKRTKNVDAASTLNTAVDFLTSSHPNSKDHWIPESLVWDQTAQNYQIVVLNNLDQSKFLVVIDSKTGNVVKFEQKP